MKTLRAVSVSFLFFSVFFCSFQVKASLRRRLPSSANEDDDARRLLDFKAAVSSLDALLDWLPGKRVCDFYGVACTAGCVSSLALSSRRVTVDLRHVVALLMGLDGLENLRLSSADVTGNVSAFAGPRAICQSPQNSLRELYLQNNQLVGGVPATLSNCSQLASLDVGFNFLTGTIHSSLSKLSRLQDLVMWLNQLSGKIPEELSHISTMEKLILDDNWLTGRIPSGLRNCTNLNWLSLSSSLLSGEIPAWVGLLPNLAILQLKNNSFYGAIPPELGDCRSLIWLDLNSNRLTGPIPASLAKQSGSITVGFISGNHHAYLKRAHLPRCWKPPRVRRNPAEQLLRVPSRHACNFTRPYISDTHYTFNKNGSMIFLDLF